MFNKMSRWMFWVFIGLILLGLLVLHFTKAWLLPDYVVLTVGICLGMYALLFVDAIVGEMVKNKKVKGE